MQYSPLFNIDGLSSEVNFTWYVTLPQSRPKANNKSHLMNLLRDVIAELSVSLLVFSIC